VQPLLPVLHLVRVPVRDPVHHPHEVNEPSNYEKYEQLKFLILKTIKTH
jgi:hypothetical protein